MAKKKNQIKALIREILQHNKEVEAAVKNGVFTKEQAKELMF